MKSIYLLTILLYLGCDNISEVNTFTMDITPPQILSLSATESNQLTIKCNEPISFIEESFYSREGLIINDFSNNNPNSILLDFTYDLTPGKEYCSEFRIEDENGNSLSFIGKYYGLNSNLPELIINEFIVKGTKTNPDKVELYIIKGGNMAGITIFNGSKDSYDYSYTFPEIIVETGEYIVLRSTSDNYSSVCIEIDDLNINNDKKFITGVRDLRINNFSFSSTNGGIGLYSNPFGILLDCVLYSKNYNDESKDYRNFGLSKTLERIDELTEDGGWVGTYDLIFPDDTIYIGDSTTTRSLNRVNFIDSDSNNDWKTVDTSESTFGFPNSTNYY